MTEKKEIEAERFDVSMEHRFNRPWENNTADDTFTIPPMDIKGSWQNGDGQRTDFNAKELHINITQPGYSASALVTAFGVGVLAGVTLLAILWTHLPT
jgi:hypothetical protein